MDNVYIEWICIEVDLSNEHADLGIQCPTFSDEFRGSESPERRNIPCKIWDLIINVQKVQIILPPELYNPLPFGVAEIPQGKKCPNLSLQNIYLEYSRHKYSTA